MNRKLSGFPNCLLYDQACKDCCQPPAPFPKNHPDISRFAQKKVAFTGGTHQAERKI